MGGRLIAAADPHDSVGVLDRYFHECRFFTEIERFDRHLEKLRRVSDQERVHFVSICSPNYLHDAHVRLALRLHANAICEKPLVISPWNLAPLADLEQESGCRVFNVLQLRYLEPLIELQKQIAAQRPTDRHRVDLTYISSRGPWYGASWKGSVEKSGGVATNIGIHFFDLLIWLFGNAESHELHVSAADRMSGLIHLDRAEVRWFLSTRREDLPAKQRAEGKPSYRSIRIDGHEVEFSEGFTDLHASVYRDALAGKGFGIRDAAPSIQLAYDIRTSEVRPHGASAHPFVLGKELR